MGLVDAVKNRHSTRWYSKRAVPQEVLLQVVAAGRNAVPLRPEIEVRWYIVWDGSVLNVRPRDIAGACEDSSRFYLAPGYADKTEPSPGRASKHDPRALVSPPHYIMAVSKQRPGFVENIGFCMEQLTLAAEDKRLGTCWVSALSPRNAPPSDLEQLLASIVPDLGADERIVSLTPVGYPARSQSAQLAQQLARWEVENPPVRPQERIFWDVWGVPWAPQATGSHAASVEQDRWTVARRDRALKRACQLADHAPSWGYEKPWRFVVDDRRVIAVIQTANSPSAPTAGAHAPEAYARLGGGIAMCHFYLGALEMGLLPERTADLAPVTTDGLWRIPGSMERDQLRRQHGIPDQCEILGLFPLPSTEDIG